MKILVTGSNGCLGKELRKKLIGRNVSFLTRNDCDLENANDVKWTMARYKPDYVINCAAKVGGLADNMAHQYDYFNRNVSINNNIIHACLIHSVPRLLCFSSSCAYPDVLPENYYPMIEDNVHLGIPTTTNFSYGYAKRVMQVQIDSCNRQYGTKFSYITPSNLYGPTDNFEESGHFLAKLIRAIWLFKIGRTNDIVMKGSGEAMRQYTHVSDLAKCVIFHIDNDIQANYNFSYPMNIKTSIIAEIALKTCGVDSVVKFTGEVSAGQLRKDISIAKFLRIQPEFQFTPLYDGIKQTYNEIDKRWSVAS